MGLSSKQVSSDRHGWNQALLQANTLELPKPASMKRQSSQVQQQEQQQPQQPQQQPQPQPQPQPQQQAEHLKCPRCESSNTKFCYYNNYNRSQPRHFCKACKRHWTKGGTLRNVPVGGGRKNKRVKTSNSGTKAASKTITCTTTTTTTTPTGNNTNDNIKALLQQQQQQSSRFSLPLGVGAISSLGGFDDKNFTHEFYQTLVRQPPPPATNTTSSAAALPETSITFNTTKGLNHGIFLGATHDNHHDHHNNDDLQFPYSNLGSFESDNPCSISPSNFYNLASDHHHHHQPNNGLEETVMNSLSSSSLSDHHHQTWSATTPTTAATATTTTTPTTANSVMMDISSNWGWDDFDKFVTVDADLTMPWDDDDDDADIKPSAGPL